MLLLQQGGFQKIRPPSLLHISTTVKDKRMVENDDDNDDDDEHPYAFNTLPHSACVLLMSLP